MASTKRHKGRPTNTWLTEQDKANARKIVRDGWASTRTGAIRIALKHFVEEKCA